MRSRNSWGCPPSRHARSSLRTSFPRGCRPHSSRAPWGWRGRRTRSTQPVRRRFIPLHSPPASFSSGRADAMLCGGVSRPDALYIQMGFSQLRALSARGRPSPFDRNADGLVAGEGAGMFVLKRLEDALEHGDRIYGLVAAVGLSNDCRGDLLAPSSEGQLRAMRLAYQKAGWSPGRRRLDRMPRHRRGRG